MLTKLSSICLTISVVEFFATLAHNFGEFKVSIVSGRDNQKYKCMVTILMNMSCPNRVRFRSSLELSRHYFGNIEMVEMVPTCKDLYHYMGAVHQHGSSVITVLLADCVSLCPDSWGRRSTPRSRLPRSLLSHAIIVRLKIGVFILYFQRFFYSLIFF